jgi:beta-lactamase regulating signal transducer with metallopeptidase domain
MTFNAAIQASTNLLAHLANPAARSLVLGLASGAALAAFRVKTTSTRLFTWTAVLYAALAMPLLGWMLPPLPIPAPAFLQRVVNNQNGSGSIQPSVVSPLAAERRQNAAHGASRGENVATVTQPRRGERPTLPPDQVHASSLPLPANAHPAKTTAASLPFSFPTVSLAMVAAGLYLTVATLLLVRFFVGLAFGRRLTQSSQRIDDARVNERLAARAFPSMLTSTPKVAESELISVPVTMGALDSIILLPADWRDWDDAKLDAVIAHEVSHVVRHDGLTQRLSLLHRAIFWFSPLAWYLDRHLADLAEQASDEAALSYGADRKHYARILLEFFEALHAAPGRVWWQGVSMAKAGQAEERVERILSWKGSVAMRLKKSIAIVVVALAVPLVYLAASVHAASNVSSTIVAAHSVSFARGQATAPPSPTPAPRANVSTPPASAPNAAAAPDATPAPEAAPQIAPLAIRGTVYGIPVPPNAPVSGIPGGVVAPPATAGMAYPPYPPTPAVAWSSGQSHSYGSSSSSSSSSARGYSYAYGYDDDDNQRFVIVTGKSDSLTMSGSSEDARHVEKLRKSIPGDFIWFERDEKSYVIRDQATIDRARAFWAPQEELGKKQEALGKQQEELGKQQEALGSKMEQVQVRVPDMTAELDKLKAELKALSAGATMEQVGQLQSEIGDLQSKIGDIQSQAGEQQSKLGEQQGALGEKQGKLGEEQGKLGEQQAKLAHEATKKMKQLFDEAITKGTAQPEL